VSGGKSGGNEGISTMNDGSAWGTLLLDQNTLAFFVDDSGDQILGDPANPLFALGGVSVHGADYLAVASAWREASAGISRGKGGKHFSQGEP
jgi:hypothetical protein